MFIQIIGSGKMGNVLAVACRDQGIEFHFMTYQGALSTGSQPDYLKCMAKKAVMIHFGSGSELPLALDWATEFDIPLIQGSTSLEEPIETLLLGNEGATVVEAPNLSIPIVKFMKSFPDFAGYMGEDMDTHIVESHQAGKTDVSGTARAIAETIDLPVDEIVSVRDTATQLALGVPSEHASGHAYHFLTLTGQGVEIQTTVKVHGRETYALGAIEIAKLVLQHKEKIRGKLVYLPDIIDLLPE